MKHLKENRGNTEKYKQWLKNKKGIEIQDKKLLKYMIILVIVWLK